MWKYYAPLVNKDHLLFHVALLLSASDIERAQPPATRLRCRRLEPLCVQLLQQRINAPLPESVSDETLAAVSGLASFEVRTSPDRFRSSSDFFSMMKDAVHQSASTLMACVAF